MVIKTQHKTKGKNMKQTTNRILAGVASSFLALAFCTVPVRAESPVQEVTLAGHDFTLDEDTGLWNGTLTLTVNGTDYEGTGTWQLTALRINDNTFHWFATAVYDFGELGSFEICENGKAKILEPNAGLSGMNQVGGGTGAFEGVHGVLQYQVYESLESGINFVASGHLYFDPDADE